MNDLDRDGGLAASGQDLSQMRPEESQVARRNFEEYPPKKSASHRQEPRRGKRSFFQMVFGGGASEP